MKEDRVDVKDNNGWTPLSWAAWKGHTEVVKVLLDAKANAEVKDDDLGRTPLSWAAGNGHTEVVKVLLDVKANVEAKDKYLRPPRRGAADEHTEAVKVLLDVKANVEVKDNAIGLTPLSRAAEDGHGEAV